MRRPTEAELRVLELLGQGHSPKQIGEELGVTVNTVRTHTANAMRVMKVHTRTHAVAIALCKGWIDC